MAGAVYEDYGGGTVGFDYDVLSVYPLGFCTSTSYLPTLVR